MFRRLVSAAAQSRSAKTVELFGWLIIAEGAVVLLAPHFSASLLGIPPLTEQGANYYRLVGLLVSGVGMLYIASGRLNAEGFVFASMLDRPLVPIAMALLWYLDSWAAGVDFFDTRFWQLSLDPNRVAERESRGRNTLAQGRGCPSILSTIVLKSDRLRS